MKTDHAHARLKSDDEPTARDYWPTKSWRSASPESQGFDASKLTAAAELVHHFNLGGRKLNASHWEMTSGADAFMVTRGGYRSAKDTLYRYYLFYKDFTYPRLTSRGSIV